MKHKKVTMPPDGATITTAKSPASNIYVLPPLSKKDGNAVRLGKSLLAWLWKWLQIYLHNIYVRTMPEKPQNRWPVILSILTFAALVLSMYWTNNDRDDKRVKEIQAAAFEAGQRNSAETERDKKIANQAAEIETLKRTLGLLPPTPKPPKGEK